MVVVLCHKQEYIVFVEQVLPESHRFDAFDVKPRSQCYLMSFRRRSKYGECEFEFKLERVPASHVILPSLTRSCL